MTRTGRKRDRADPSPFCLAKQTLPSSAVAPLRRMHRWVGLCAPLRPAYCNSRANAKSSPREQKPGRLGSTRGTASGERRSGLAAGDELWHEFLNVAGEFGNTVSARRHRDRRDVRRRSAQR